MKLGIRMKLTDNRKVFRNPGKQLIYLTNRREKPKNFEKIVLPSLEGSPQEGVGKCQLQKKTGVDIQKSS